MCECTDHVTTADLQALGLLDVAPRLDRIRADLADFVDTWALCEKLSRLCIYMIYAGLILLGWRVGQLMEAAGVK
jgi:hypothetical protein